VLVEFLNGFKIQCQVLLCGCFVENIEVHEVHVLLYTLYMWEWTQVFMVN
jgi:hypothetical protein